MEKYALVIGASGGIGLHIAKKLAEDGYSLILHYNERISRIRELVEELEGVNIIVVQADLSKGKGIEILVSELKVPVDVVVYTSGNSHIGLITDVTTDTLQAMIQLHVTSPFQLIKHLLPQMIQRKYGNIIIISSIWGITGASCEVLYSTVKGAQNTFVKALAKEVARSGVRVNAVAPGAIETGMMEMFSEEDQALICEDIPMGRLGKSEEVAAVVSFLVSEQASYITGQIISVNGGWYT